MSATKTHAADDGTKWLNGRGSLCGLPPWWIRAPVLDPENPLARSVTCKKCLRILDAARRATGGEREGT